MMKFYLTVFILFIFTFSDAQKLSDRELCLCIHSDSLTETCENLYELWDSLYKSSDQAGKESMVDHMDALYARENCEFNPYYDHLEQNIKECDCFDKKSAAYKNDNCKNLRSTWKNDLKKAAGKEEKNELKSQQQDVIAQCADNTMHFCDCLDNQFKTLRCVKIADSLNGGVVEASYSQKSISRAKSIIDSMVHICYTEKFGSFPKTVFDLTEEDICSCVDSSETPKCGALAKMIEDYIETASETDQQRLFDFLEGKSYKCSMPKILRNKGIEVENICFCALMDTDNSSNMCDSLGNKFESIYNTANKSDQEEIMTYVQDVIDRCKQTNEEEVDTELFNKRVICDCMKEEEQSPKCAELAETFKHTYENASEELQEKLMQYVVEISEQCQPEESDEK